MTFIVLEKYCKSVLSCKAMDLIGIKRCQWYEYKRENRLPLKHCKTICNHFNYHITDNMEELTNIIIDRYYEEV